MKRRQATHDRARLPLWLLGRRLDRLDRQARDGHVLLRHDPANRGRGFDERRIARLRLPRNA
jgi:hypothetical protein